jgi:plastocyanin
MKKWALLGLLVLIATIPAGAASGGEELTTIRAVGRFNVEINEALNIAFRFAPQAVTVASGDEIRFSNRTFDEPHTLTIAKKSELPTNVRQVFNCGGPGTACEPARGHVDENFNPIPGKEVLNAGPAGLNQKGDSLFVHPRGERGQRITAVVSAPNGTNLPYVCAVHPWMQGVIRVRG